MKKLNKTDKKYLKFAKMFISLRGKYQYGEKPDFSDMSSVIIFHESFFNWQVGIKACVNFDDNTVHYYAEGVEYAVEEFDNIKDLVEYRICRCEEFYYEGDFVDNKDLFPPRELTDRLIHWGYEILKPKYDQNVGDLRFYNCKERFSGRIPQDFDLSHFTTYSVEYDQKEFDGHPLDDDDIIVIHGGGKIFTFQAKNGKYRKVENFFSMIE